MTMELLNTEFTRALAYTLFHSIWQATAIALMMSVVLSFVKRSSAKKRYLISISALFSVVGASIITFIRYYAPEGTEAATTSFGEVFADYENIIILASDNGWISTIKELLLSNANWIALAYSFGMIFFILRIALGLVNNSKFKYSSRMLEHKWAYEMLSSLKEKAFYKKHVDLKESIKINNPSVIGFLKPCIYFPIGLLNNLAPDEVEAILAHELAHIVRNDYLVNILQSGIEAIYYFHPAVWWISANIRNEREHACDDLAIDIIGDKIKYAKSLVHLQEWEQHAQPNLAMSFSNKETPLFERIKRILNQPKNKHEMRQKVFASVILLSSILWISATHPNHQELAEVEESYFEEIIDVEPDEFTFEYIDTVPKASKSTIVELKDGKIQRLEIDGREIPEEEFEQHDELVEDLRIDRIPSYSQFPIHIFPNDQDFSIISGDVYQYSKDLLDDFEYEIKEIRPFFDEQREDLEELGNNFQFHFSEEMNDFNDYLAEVDILDGDRYFYYHGDDSLRHHFDSLRMQIGDLDFPEMARDVEDFIASLKIPELAEEAFIYIDSIDWGGIGRDIRIAIDSFDLPDFDGFHYNYNYGNGSNLEERFIRELKKDDLYAEGINQIVLEYDALKINGDRMPDELIEKYKEIYEETTGTRILKGSIMNIELEQEGNNYNSNFRRI